MTTTTYEVAGMSCGHCVAAVTKELTDLAEVTSVDVQLVAEGNSHVTVTSPEPLAIADVTAAIDRAGYTLIA